MIWMVVSNIFFMFIRKFGEMIQFDEHIFQRGEKPTNQSYMDPMGVVNA